MRNIFVEMINRGCISFCLCLIAVWNVQATKPHIDPNASIDEISKSGTNHVDLNLSMQMIKQNYYSDDDIAEVYFIALFDAIKNRVEIDARQAIKTDTLARVKSRLDDVKLSHLFERFGDEIRKSGVDSPACIKNCRQEYAKVLTGFRDEYLKCADAAIKQGIITITDQIEISTLPIDEPEMVNHLAPCIEQPPPGAVRCLHARFVTLFKKIPMNLAPGEKDIPSIIKETLTNVVACEPRTRDKYFQPHFDGILTRGVECAQLLESRR